SSIFLVVWCLCLLFRSRNHLFPSDLRLAPIYTTAQSFRRFAPLAWFVGRPLPLGRVVGGASVRGFSASARRGRRFASADFSPSAVACGGGVSSLSAALCGGFRGALTLVAPSLVAAASASPNPAVNLAPFGRWTLRDNAAQRRLPQR
ncbi:MAG: hypothetical protein Q7U97_12600, partial [Rhodocyclaceae bacterium]|nr:hypothetical protein [Rhodocyclaceae bacterium]